MDKNAATSSKIVASETEVVTILMCDIVNSTRLATVQSPRQLKQTLTDYYAICEKCVNPANGRIIRYVGDAVLCVFDKSGEIVGPKLSIKTANLILEQIADLKVPLGEEMTPIQVRITIATGLCIHSVYFGSEGYKQELVFGKIPFLADRLKDFTKPNEITVCARTAKSLLTAWKLNNKGEVKLKGFEEVQEVWHFSGQFSPTAKLTASHH